MDFDAIRAVTLGWEGGVADHPDDPGGLTNHGVTQGTYDAWRRGRGLEPRAVTEIAPAEAEAIYREGYWEPVRAAELPGGLALMMADTAFHHGAGRAIRFLQETVGVRADGAFGPITKAVARAQWERDAGGLIRELSARRAHYLATRPHATAFLRGWLRRVFGVALVASDHKGQAWPASADETMEV